MSIDLSNYTLTELLDLEGTAMIDIEQAWCEYYSWNGEDRDFCDSQYFNWMCSDIKDEIEYRLSLARWD